MAINQPPQGRPPSSAPNGGKITAQVHTTEIGPDNRPVRGVRVSFITGKQNKGSVFVPETEYQDANVIAAVRAAANRMDALHNADI